MRWVWLARLSSVIVSEIMMGELLDHDPDVLSSAEIIAQNAENVSIVSKGVENAVNFIIKEWSDKTKDNKLYLPEPSGLNEEEILEWHFLLDSLNFCFWADNDQQLYTVEYNGKQWTGYRSMCAALCRAVENGIPIYKPSYYGKLTLQQLKEVFHSCNNTEIPMLATRLKNLHEVSDVLCQKFDGKVSCLIQKSDKSVQKLIQLLKNNFANFRDISVYKGRKVSFLKRAQIFAADVWYRFNGKGYGEFKDINTITMFADYRVPQSLLFLNILEYDKILMEQLVKGVHVDKDSEYENEIRGCSIWAVELICRGIKEYLDSDQSICSTLTASDIYPCTVDFFLWKYAKTHSKELSNIPIHRTITSSY